MLYIIAFFGDNLGCIPDLKIFPHNLKFYLTLFIISSFLSSSFREMTTYSSKRLDMSGLYVSVAKNSIKLLRLLLCLKVNSSNHLQIAKMTKYCPQLKILRSQKTRLAPQHLGLIKNIANWWYFRAAVFPSELLLFAVIPKALLAIESLNKKCHEIAVYPSKESIECKLKKLIVTLQGKSKQRSSTYYPYFYLEDLRSPINGLPQFYFNEGALSELTVQQLS